MVIDQPDSASTDLRKDLLRHTAHPSKSEGCGIKPGLFIFEAVPTERGIESLRQIGREAASEAMRFARAAELAFPSWKGALLDQPSDAREHRTNNVDEDADHATQTVR